MSAEILGACAGVEAAFAACHSHVQMGVSRLAVLPLARAVVTAAS